MEQQYTKELTPEILAGFDPSPFTAEQPAAMSDAARTLFEELKTLCRERPVSLTARMSGYTGIKLPQVQNVSPPAPKCLSRAS